MQPLTRTIHNLDRNQYPVKILQFGSENFLLGFVDWMVQVANEKTDFNAGISVIQGVSSTNPLQQPEGVYTVVLKGIREDEFVSRQYKIDIIQRVIDPANDFVSFLNEALNPDLQFIISNTGESVIAFSEQDSSVSVMASTFPGKLTQLLYKRYRHKLDNGLLILPTESHEQNGLVLKANILKYCAHWNLPKEFSNWLNIRVTFCNSLVDRVISEFPRRSSEQLLTEYNHSRNLIIEGEWFHLWVIEGPRWVEEVLPLKKAGLNVVYTDDLIPYQLRKVRILNGSHTCLAIVGLLAGLQTVREAIEHPVIGRFIKRIIYDDIIPVVPGGLLDIEKYAEGVIDRFRNPAFDHQLASVKNDSILKFNQGVLPTLLAQVEKAGLVHDRLVFVLAAFIYHYHPSKVNAINPSSDDTSAIIRKAWEEGDDSKNGMELRCHHILSSQLLWGTTLSVVPGLVDKTAHYLYSIDQSGIISSLSEW